MPQFGSVSEAKLKLLDPRLVAVLREAIRYFDFAVGETYRGKSAQDAAVNAGLSQTPWPTSKHNHRPALAADIMPWPVDWADGEKPHLRFAFMMGVVHVCAQQLGIKVRFGMDWSRNLDPRDETFLDLPHVELVDP